MFIAAFTIAKISGSNLSVHQQWNGMLLSHKRNEILPFATTWMELESIMLGEISQTEKDK